MNSTYVIVSLVSKARPQEQPCSLGPSFPWIGKVTEEHLRNLSLEGTVPLFTRSCSQVACSKMLSGSKKEERQKDEAERLNVMKTWCKTNWLLLQAFAMESGAESGSESRTSEWEWGHESRSKYTVDGQKTQGDQLLETSDYSFIWKGNTRERKLFSWRNITTIIFCEY